METTIEVAPPGWRPGDTRSFTITKTRDDTAQPWLGDVSSTTQVEVVVEDVGADGARLRWQQSGEGALGVPGFQKVLTPEMARVIREFGDLMIEYSTDEAGQFVTVHNRDAVRRQLEDVIDLVEDLPGSQELAEGSEKMRPVIDTFIETAVVEDVVALHGAYGLVLDRYGSKQFEAELPNPFGGDPIPAAGSIEVLTDRDASNCVLIQSIYVPKPGAFRVIAENLGDIAGLDDAGRASIRASLDEIEVRHEVRHAFDPSSGWITKVELEETIADGVGTRTDRTVIESR